MADINYNENWIGYTLGFSQANIERIAAGVGIPWRLLATRVGALLQHSESGPIMGPPGGMPELRGEAGEIGSEDMGREVPQSGSVAVAGNASGQVRRITTHSNANGKLKPGPLLLQLLNDKGKLRIFEAIRDVQESHPKMAEPALRSAIERYVATGKLKKATDGVHTSIRITAAGKSLLSNNGVHTVSAETKRKISESQNKRYQRKKTASSVPETGSLKQTLRDFMSTVTTPLSPKQVGIRFKAQYPNVKFTPQQLRNTLYWSARGGHVFRSKGGGYSVGRAKGNSNSNQLQDKLNEIFPSGRKAPTREAVMSVMRNVSGPLKRADVVKLVHKQYPKLTKKSIHNALENGSRKGFFHRSDAGYTVGKAEIKPRSLAAAA